MPRHSNVSGKIICNLCDGTFSHSYCLKKHLEEKRCPVLKKQELEKQKLTDSTLTSLLREINDLKDKNVIATKGHLELIQEVNRLSSVTQTPSTVTNNLQVMCVTSNDNYFDRL